jgi:hypothetical protein
MQPGRFGQDCKREWTNRVAKRRRGREIDSARTIDTIGIRLAKPSVEVMIDRGCFRVTTAVIRPIATIAAMYNDKIRSGS